jgi:hypothetical protein
MPELDKKPNLSAWATAWIPEPRSNPAKTNNFWIIVFASTFTLCGVEQISPIAAFTSSGNQCCAKFKLKTGIADCNLKVAISGYSVNTGGPNVSLCRFAHRA